MNNENLPEGLAPGAEPARPHPAPNTDRARIREMAARLDCFVEGDLQLLAGATAKTVEAWRKRGQGPAYILFGNQYLYPIEEVSQHLQNRLRNTPATVRGAL